MNLQSGKVLIKRPKHSYAPDIKYVTKQEEKEEIISKLPDELLTKILCLLPDAREAKRTCILSKRWKHIWAFLPNLYFVMPFCRYNKQVNEYYEEIERPDSSSKEQVQSFHDSVDKALDLRNGMPIQKFFLFCSKECDFNHVSKWLHTVVRCKIQQLELRFPANIYSVGFYCDILKNCDTLIELTLKGKFVVDVPESNDVLFPSLKKLNLISIVYSSEHTLANVISQCPVLEELFVKNKFLRGYDYLETFKVSSASLKRLRISFNNNNCSRTHNVVIDAPKLEYIYILDHVSTNYHMTEPLSLVEAHINVSRRILELFTRLSPVKILTLTCQTIHAFDTIHSLIRDRPLFPNLVKLVIGINGTWEWDFLLVLLNHMPNLEHITFSDGLLCAKQIYVMKCNPPVETSPPACLLSHVKEITILNLAAVIWEEFSFIKYLLNNANKLELFTINAPKICPKRRKKILRFYRGSKFCQVEFV